MMVFLLLRPYECRGSDFDLEFKSVIIMPASGFSTHGYKSPSLEKKYGTRFEHAFTGKNLSYSPVNQK